MTLDVAVIETERLVLVSLSPEAIDALLEGDRARAEEVTGVRIPDGWPDENVERFLRYRRGQLAEDPAEQQWLVRAITLREEGRPMVGSAGFHGRPGRNSAGNPNALEVGYSIFPEYRGRGFATEAARGLLEWAQRERGIRDFVASVQPGNEPSLAVVRKLGFTRTGEHMDEIDGLELVVELRLDSSRARGPDP